MHRAEGAKGRVPFVPKLWALVFDDVAAPVVLPDDPSLIDALCKCIHGWPFRLVPFAPDAAAPVPPLCVIERRAPGRFRAHSRYLAEPLDNLCGATAICVVLADLSQAYSDLCRDHVFGLHCAGVSIGARTLVLAGERRAGKSTLVARLSCEAGVEILGDDVLPIADDGTVIGLGLAPRLRLPLPRQASAPFRAHVQTCLGPADDRYGYLLTPALAPHGRRARAEAFVLLDRRADGAASLHALPMDEVLRALVERSIAGPDGPEAVFKAARPLCSGLVGLRLVYSDLEDAVALLLAAFPSSGRAVGQSVSLSPPGTPAMPAVVEAMPILTPSARCRRADGIATRRIGGAAFLWRPGEAMLWHLNPTAQAIWALLERPASAQTLARDLGLLFPDEPDDQLLNGTRLLLGQLIDQGFVEAVPRKKTKGAVV